MAFRSKSLGRLAHPRRRALRRTLGLGLALSLLVSGGLLSQSLIASTQPAAAVTSDDFPTWGDVEKARSNQASKEAQITEIEGLISGLQDAYAVAAQKAQDAANVFFAAQQEYDQASVKAQALRTQADDAAKAAEDSQKQASILAAQLARSGNSDITMNLLTESDQAGDLLYQLGAMTQLTERTAKIFDKAEQDKNDAASLADQADVAEAELGKLRDAASAAYQNNLVLQQQAQDSLVAQQDNEATLQAQLTVLKEDRKATYADYEAGVEWKAEQERIRLAKIEAERKRAAAAEAARIKREQEEAARNEGSGGGGGGGAAPAPVTPIETSPSPVSSGWSMPFPGAYASSPFGWRYIDWLGGWNLHTGHDMTKGDACGAGVFAANSGTVTYASWQDGGGGNVVIIDHGNGVYTWYAHLSQFLVSYGQQVSSGQMIALAGTTGSSSGCHLHFEVRTGGDGFAGTAQDPVPFMAAQGITLPS